MGLAAIGNLGRDEIALAHCEHRRPLAASTDCFGDFGEGGVYRAFRRMSWPSGESVRS